MKVDTVLRQDTEWAKGVNRLLHGTANDRARATIFVLRFALVPYISFAVAHALGLGHPIWAVVSSLIVSQSSATETRKSFLWRVLGTFVGLASAAAIGSLYPSLDPALTLSLVVVPCAVFARFVPAARVSMWTGPLVILTATSGHTVLQSAFERGAEVTLGGFIGAAIHLAVEPLTRKLRMIDSVDDED